MQPNLHKILELIDLTSLNDADNEKVIAALCQKAEISNTHVAAVCVYPRFVSEVKKLLVNKSIHIAAVANFPSGNELLKPVCDSIRQSISEGANEIDVVFPYQDYLSGEKEKAYDFIRACKAACGNEVLLKVILETGALLNISTIAEVSHDLCHAGADFLKTSTGKIPVGATPEAARAMLTVIKKIPRPIGFKASGGVSSIEQAQQYIKLAEEIMGPAWVTPAHFRIGASQLVDVIRESLSS